MVFSYATRLFFTRLFIAFEFVCLSVCLSVCAQTVPQEVTSRFEPNNVKVYRRLTKEEVCKFWTDPGSFFHFLKNCEMAHFSTFSERWWKSKLCEWFVTVMGFTIFNVCHYYCARY